VESERSDYPVAAFCNWVLSFHRPNSQIALRERFRMFGTKSGLRVIAAIVAAAVLSLGVAPANAANPYSKTLAFLKSKFVNGQFIEGFTPGVADFGFTLEGILQRKSLGDSTSGLAKAVAYNLENTAITGTTAKRGGYLFDAEGNLKLGTAGKFAFVSKVVSAKNGPLRAAVVKAIVNKIDATSDLPASYNTYDRAWAVLALDANGYEKQATVLAAKLVKQQRVDGGFNDGYDTTASSADGTGIVLQAFASVKGQGITAHKTAIAASITKAVNYLRRTLVTRDHYEAYGDFNTNSTGYAGQGLIAVGKPHAPIKTWLVSKLATDGGIKSAWSGSAGDIYATAQAAIVLTGKSYVDLLGK
jgi:hypothetical protein